MRLKLIKVKFQKVLIWTDIFQTNSSLMRTATGTVYTGEQSLH